MDHGLFEAFRQLSTATITTVLMKKGLRNVWLRGPAMLDLDQPRIAGPAFTMRFVPGREDLATPKSLSSPRSTRFAIEEMPSGCIAVVSAGGIVDAGIFGDILCARMVKRRLAGLVTDGAMRDLDGPAGAHFDRRAPSWSVLQIVDRLGYRRLRQAERACRGGHGPVLAYREKDVERAKVEWQSSMPDDIIKTYSPHKSRIG